MKSKKMIIGVVFCVAMVAICLIPKKDVQAAKPYKNTTVDGRYGFSNGSKMYYTEQNVLYRYSVKTKKSTRLKKLPASGDASFTVSGVISGKVFLTKGSFEQWKVWTYVYNTKKRTVKKVKTNCSILDISGKYAVAVKEYHTDVSPYTMSIYKITSSGLKKVKTIARRGFSAKFIGSKLYYTSYPKGSSMRKSTLYKCSKDGSKKVAIKTFKSEEEYGMVIIYPTTSKYCNVYIDEQNYKYTFKSKKIKEINI